MANRIGSAFFPAVQRSISHCAPGPVNLFAGDWIEIVRFKYLPLIKLWRSYGGKLRIISSGVGIILKSVHWSAFLARLKVQYLHHPPNWWFQFSLLCQLRTCHVIYNWNPNKYSTEVWDQLLVNLFVTLYADKNGSCFIWHHFGVAFELGDYCILVPWRQILLEPKGIQISDKLTDPNVAQLKHFPCLWPTCFFHSFLSGRPLPPYIARRMSYSDNPHGHLHSPFVQFMSWAKVSSDFHHQRRSTIALITWQRLLTLEYRLFFR